MVSAVFHSPLGLAPEPAMLPASGLGNSHLPRSEAANEVIAKPVLAPGDTRPAQASALSRQKRFLFTQVHLFPLV